MRIINAKTGESFSVQPHGNNKEPAYFAASKLRRKVTINGKAAEMVCRPKSETSVRVNFKIGAANYFVDNAKLHDTVRKGNTVLDFTTAVGRTPKAEVKEAAKAAPKPAAKPATTTAPKTEAKPEADAKPAYQPPLGAAAIANAPAA